MTLEDYSRNVRGINDGESFTPEFVVSSPVPCPTPYDDRFQSPANDIRSDSETRDCHARRTHWSSGIRIRVEGVVGSFKTSRYDRVVPVAAGFLYFPAGSYISYNTPIFDKKMFEAVWKPVISAVAHAFTSFEDDHIIERSIAGFRQCATLAGYLILPDVFDYVVVSLSQATSLLSEQLPTRVPNYPVVTVESQPVTVSTLSVKFGTNFRGQLAAVVLFNIVNGNGNALREGWTQVRRDNGFVRLGSSLGIRYSKCSRTSSYTPCSPQVCCRWRTS